MHELVVSSVYNSNNCVFLILEFNVAFKNRKDFGPLNIIYVCTRASFQPVPPCHGTGYFFSLEVSKVSKVSNFFRFHNQKVSKWHLLIFTPFGALVY